MAARLVYINDEGGCDASGRPFRSFAKLRDALCACDVLCVSQTIASAGVLKQRLQRLLKERTIKRRLLHVKDLKRILGHKMGDAEEGIRRLDEALLWRILTLAVPHTVPSTLILGKNMGFDSARVAIQWWDGLPLDEAKPRTLALHDCWQTAIGDTPVRALALMGDIEDAGVATLRVSQECRGEKKGLNVADMFASLKSCTIDPALMPKKLHLIGIDTDPWFSQWLVLMCADVKEIAFLRVRNPVWYLPWEDQEQLTEFSQVWFCECDHGSAPSSHFDNLASSFPNVHINHDKAPARWAPAFAPDALIGSAAAGQTLPRPTISNSACLQETLRRARWVDTPGYEALAALRKQAANYRIGGPSIFVTLTTRQPRVNVGYVKNISAVCTGEEELRSAVEQVLRPHYECEIDTIKVYRLNSTFRFPCLRILSGEHTYLLLFYFSMTVRNGVCSEQTSMWCVYDATGKTLTVELENEVVSEFASEMDIDLDRVDLRPGGGARARRRAASPKGWNDDVDLHNPPATPSSMDSPSRARGMEDEQADELPVVARGEYNDLARRHNRLVENYDLLVKRNENLAEQCETLSLKVRNMQIREDLQAKENLDLMRENDNLKRRIAMMEERWGTLEEDDSNGKGKKKESSWWPFNKGPSKADAPQAKALKLHSGATTPAPPPREFKAW